MVWQCSSSGSRFVPPGTSRLGHAGGEWPDATIVYLDVNESNGRILHVGWATTNILIEGPRSSSAPLEAYPNEFLLESIDALSD